MVFESTVIFINSHVESDASVLFCLSELEVKADAAGFLLKEVTWQEPDESAKAMSWLKRPNQQEAERLHPIVHEQVFSRNSFLI